MTGPPQFTLQFTVELAKFPPQIPVTIVEPGLMGVTELLPQLPVTIVEPGFPLELAAPVMPHSLEISGALGLGINGNPLPQIPESLINWTLPLMEISPVT